MTPSNGLNAREKEVLTLLVAMHTEEGLTARFTSRDIAQRAGSPCAGSLAGLAVRGYVSQQHGPDGVGYRMTERGWAHFAGVENQVPIDGEIVL